ncbi:metal-sensitive transcriptional regulator [Candidatus Avelusimicrobium sp.]
MENKHPCHKAELPRLNRVIGQLEGIKKMIDEQRYCPEILIQLKAVRSAIISVEKNILSTHLEKCVADSFDNKNTAQEKIAEIKELFNKLQH